MATFTGYIRATARVTCDALEVEANTIAEAIAKVKAEGTSPYIFDFEECDLEGDELAYLVMTEDFTDPETGVSYGPRSESIEIDMRAPAEPFSWAACTAIKAIAATADIPDDAALLEDRPRLLAELAAWRKAQTSARAMLSPPATAEA